MTTVSIDSDDFGEIRSRGYAYVDKTTWLHRLATARSCEVDALVSLMRNFANMA